MQRTLALPTHHTKGVAPMQRAPAIAADPAPEPKARPSLQRESKKDAPANSCHRDGGAKIVSPCCSCYSLARTTVMLAVVALLGCLHLTLGHCLIQRAWIAPRTGDSIAVCAIVRNSGVFVREWVLYHRAIGVQHLYVYDNNQAGEDDLRALLQPMQNYTTIVRLAGVMTKKLQIATYASCRRQHGSRHRWILQIDADEYVAIHAVGPSGRPMQLPELLRTHFSDVSQVSFIWALTCTWNRVRSYDSAICGGGSSSVTYHKPNGKGLKKSVCQPEFWYSRHSAHDLGTLSLYKADCPENIAVILHFHARSVEDFLLAKHVNFKNGLLASNTNQTNWDWHGWRVYLHIARLCSAKAARSTFDFTHVYQAVCPALSAAASVYRHEVHSKVLSEARKLPRCKQVVGWLEGDRDTVNMSAIGGLVKARACEPVFQ